MMVCGGVVAILQLLNKGWNLELPPEPSETERC